MRTEAPLTPTTTPLVARRAAAYPALLLVFLAAIGPTLTWLEFSGSMENLNIATAVELRREHPRLRDWLVPTLEGEPRLKKPPMTAWLTALAIRPATVKELSDPDPKIRAAAAERLAFQARWPALLAACLMLLATYELGRACADPTTGLVAAIVCGSTPMFLRFGRFSMVDVHLGLWVTLANVFLAHAILHGRRWSGCLGAGAALGIAWMTKGPVALVQSLAPALVFVVVEFFKNRDRRETAVAAWIGPILAGLLLMLTLAAPWYVYAPGALRALIGEASAERGERPSGPLQYLLVLPYMLPWTVLMIGGMITAFATRQRGLLLAASFCLVSLVLMSVYKDRQERYAYPVTPALAVVTAAGLVALARKRDPWNNWDRAAVIQHYVLLVLAGVCLPALAATAYVKELTTVTGQPWLSRPSGAAVTVALGLAIAAAMLVRRRWAVALCVATLVTTLTIQAALVPGYARTDSGLSPMRPLADVIWQTYADAQMYNAHPKGKRASVDLSIYLNRVTQWISMEDLAALRPGPRAKVVVMLQDKDAPPPTPPQGWRYLHEVPRDKDHWWAFALPPIGVR
jgi:4-amino-4-deoxy-L-arabinose transferase-like glycosyltransferase